MSREGLEVTPDEFRRACGSFATGVAIATVLDAQRQPHGLTVSSFTSVSLEPPLVLICLGHAVTIVEAFRRATHFGINVLAASQRSISERFARKGEDRFNGTPWIPGATGVPLLPGALAQMECAVEQIVTSGDHDILIGRMVRMAAIDGDPLLYFSGGYRELCG
jgi:flavin reductase (DIM6/NTAB) family NADH-FMN oxidoreductase RutF